LTDSDLNTVRIKSSFDGRLQYFDNLKKYMDALSDAILVNNLHLQYRALNGMFYLTAPYIKKEPNADAEALFKRIHLNLSMNKMTSDIAAAKDLSELSRLIFFNAKHLLLPQKLDDNEEIDWDSFD